MARAQENGNGKLADALATLIQTQANFLAQKAETDQRIVENEKEYIKIEKELVQIEREFAQIEKEKIALRKLDADLRQQADERFGRIEAILMEHSEILNYLQEAFRDRIGFKPATTSEPQK